MSAPKCVGCMVFPRTLFQHCNPFELDLQFAQRQFLKLAKGDKIFHEGDEPEAIYCVYSGTAKITKKDASGEDHITRFTRVGEIVGIHAIVGRHAYFRSAQAVTDMEACRIPKEAFHGFMEKTPPFFFEVMRFLCAEVEEVETKMEDLRHMSARQRLAMGLLRLRETHGLNEDRLLNLEVSMEDMANFLSTNKSSLYRLLNEFKSEKLIGIQNERIQILQENKLRRITRAG